MFINKLLVFIMGLFMFLGAIDRCLNNKYGFGQEFDEGIKSGAQLFVPMIGFICAAPLIGNILSPIVSPLYIAIGADPSIFAGSILSSDMGGYHLALEMQINPQIGEFAGGVLGAMLGGCVCFAIPFLLYITQKKDKENISLGIMIGLIAMPFGFIIGGIVANIPLSLLVINTVPIFLLSILLVLGLWKIPNKMILGFLLFSKIVMSFAAIIFAIASFQELTQIILLENLTPVTEGFLIVGSITIVLAGAYPFVYVMIKTFKKPLDKLATIFAIKPLSFAIMLTSMANILPTIPLINKLNDKKGLIISTAFMMNIGAVFGDYIGFTAGVNQYLIFPMIVAKFSGAFIAFFFAYIFCKYIIKE